MAAKALFVFCATALFIQSITAQSQCSGNTVNTDSNNIGIANGLGNGLAGNYGSGVRTVGLSLANLGGNSLGNGYGFGNGYGNGLGSGGAFVVNSYSPIAPSGISVVSENAIDGSLAVSGALPFLTAIGLEGQIPANGAAGVQYGCGNGNIGIVSENTAPVGYNGLAGPGLAGPGLAGLGYGAPLANAGLPLASAGLGGPALNGPIARPPCAANGNLF